ncbi:MAG TPA: replication-associated recombination protein A [Parachlamydiaceae bacterium]|nr:replication-associated recombination protein A [Parachlamydiaceae bacterium]
MNLPLAEQFRPSLLSDIVGQEHLVGTQGFITKMIESKKPLSILLWGPPGSGKTSIAKLFAKAFSLEFKNMNAIFSGIADIKKVVQELEATPLFSKQIVLFVDEIHRFNKAQQDAFLPFVEKGTFILVGATTENPSFYLNNALLSRLRVLQLNPLNEAALEAILNKYESKKCKLNISDDTRKYLIHASQGDGRYLLNLIENIEGLKTEKLLEIEDLKNCIQTRAALFDKGQEQHYNLISALHKAVRGSDPDAALYWFARILEGGESPLFLARRMIRMASEDIGLADPEALKLTIAAKDAYEMLGSPEGELSLAEAVVYLSLAPKSNAIYAAYGAARQKAKETTHLPPPRIILNAPTKLMKELKYGEGYIYDHDAENSFSGQNYFPDDLERLFFYYPKKIGFEREMQKRLTYFANLREKKKS